MSATVLRTSLCMAGCMRNNSYMYTHWYPLLPAAASAMLIDAHTRSIATAASRCTDLKPSRSFSAAGRNSSADDNSVVRPSCDSDHALLHYTPPKEQDLIALSSRLWQP